MARHKETQLIFRSCRNIERRASDPVKSERVIRTTHSNNDWYGIEESTGGRKKEVLKKAHRTVIPYPRSLGLDFEVRSKSFVRLSE